MKIFFPVVFVVLSMFFLGCGDEGETSVTFNQFSTNMGTEMCSKMRTCFGSDSVVSNCDQEIKTMLEEDGCRNFDSTQASPCITCLKGLDCPKVSAIFMEGSEDLSICGVCDLVCENYAD